MIEHTPASQSRIDIFPAPDGNIRVEVRFMDETAWLTQKLMADLFHVSVPTINEHLKNIFADGELAEEAVIRNFRITASDGKEYLTKHYRQSKSGAVYRKSHVTSFDVTVGVRIVWPCFVA